MSREIKIEHICRVEGHGGVTIDLEKDIVKLEIFEGSRFFEFLVAGKSYDEIPVIVCRICAICSISHMITSLMTIENAFGIQISKQTMLLRELIHCGGMLESHGLHLFCLAAPDYLGCNSIVGVADKKPELANIGLKLKKLGNRIQEIIGGGRPIHPINLRIGGFGKIPEKHELLALKNELEMAVNDGIKAAAFFSKIDTFPVDEPQYFSALKPVGNRFSFYGKNICVSENSNSGFFNENKVEEFEIRDYRKVCQEVVIQHSNAKHSLYNGKPFMTGALARVMMFGNMLYGRSKEALDMVRITRNPLCNNLAQAIELVYASQRCLEIIDELLDIRMENETLPVFQLGKCTGTAALEVPRGTLYHHYEFDESGKNIKTDIITPTAINLASMEQGVRGIVELHRQDATSVEVITSKTGMLLRAYDPCISCSVH
ncbi:MAG: Ni/Fe hydrogenase subunit alpha [bacterium]|nr:Ni/Fe hydrogenase subunit alpha [bacterium]